MSCQYIQAAGIVFVGLSVDCGEAGQLPLLCRDTQTTVISVTSTVSTTVTSTTTVITTTSTTSTVVRTQTVLLKQQDFTACSLSYDNLHLLYGPYAYADASAACQSYGWSLANLSAAKILSIQNLLVGCDPYDPTAWLQSFASFPTERCSFVYKQDNATFWFGMVLPFSSFGPCDFVESAVICEESSQSINSSDLETLTQTFNTVTTQVTTLNTVTTVQSITTTSTFRTTTTRTTTAGIVTGIIGGLF